jgi:omega-hydroxy-beta-dihydromenaquinone-9 sulfotransferase
MGFKETFFKTVGTNSFSGVTVGSWFRILRDNHFSVDAPYWPRALLISLSAFPNSITALAEQLCHRGIGQTTVESPLFILGTWRSGTTHLHNLLAVDRRHASPNLYQVTYPLTFLLTERAVSRWFDMAIIRQRPQDAVKMGVNEPQEEDFAMCAQDGQTVMLGWAFSRNASHYHRFMTLSDLSRSELAHWKSCYHLFLKKLTYRYGRPLVLKTPANTGRIETLLELFPTAKFVHIHRNPYDIFRSHMHTLRTAGPYWRLQRYDLSDAEAMQSQIIEVVKSLYQGYFAQRLLIPAGRLHHVSYAELERDPIGQIRGIYEALGLPEFCEAQQQLQAYVNSIADYKKNSFAELPVELRERIHREWRPYFDEWQYAA